MSLENIPDQNQAEESSIAQRFPVKGWRRVWYGLFVIVLPSFSFWATQIKLLKPEWQSGDLQDYVALLLDPKASLFFLFLLAYSIVCYLLLLVNADRFSSFFAIRFGIYSGVLLALQYSVILLLYLLNNGYPYPYAVFLLWFFPLYFSRIYRSAVRKWDERRVRSGLAILVLITGAIIINSLDPFSLLILPVFVITACAPFWSFLMAGQTAIWLFKKHEVKLTFPRGIGIIGWLAVYIIAWRYDILKMYELYAQLPTNEPGGCYIATAAAHGHPKLVGSQIAHLADGKSMRVNKQLQILKCAELALMAVAPQLHKFVRKIYDVVGKRLARTIQNPFLADVAYLLLKPFEWVAGFALKITIPEIDSMLKEVYPKL